MHKYINYTSEELDEIIKEHEKNIKFDVFNKNSLADFLLKVQSGNVSCRRAADVIIKKIEPYQEILKDNVEMDSFVRRVAKEVLSEKEVEGDSYGVPGIEDIVESLVNRIHSLKEKESKEVYQEQEPYKPQIGEIWEYNIENNEWVNAEILDIQSGYIMTTYLIKYKTPNRKFTIAKYVSTFFLRPHPTFKQEYKYYYFK